MLIHNLLLMLIQTRLNLIMIVAFAVYDRSPALENYMMLIVVCCGKMSRPANRCLAVTPPPHTTDITFQQPNPPPLIKFSMTKTFSKHFDCCMILGHFFEHFSCGCLLLLHPSIAIYADVVLPLPSRAMGGSSAQVAATDPCIYVPTI